MEKIKEYYPSFVSSEYKLGEYYMFIRKKFLPEHKTSDNDKKHIEETLSLNPEEAGGGLGPIKTGEAGGGLGPIETGEAGGGLGPIETGEIGGGLGPIETGEAGGGLGPIETEEAGGGLGPMKAEESDGFEPDSFDAYKKIGKQFGPYSYEAGKVIGVNEQECKIYVQFQDTAEGYCHIFKTGISSEGFDKLDQLMQNWKE